MCRVILAVGEDLRVPRRWWGQWTSDDKVADELTTLAEEMTTFFLGQQKEPPSYYQVGVSYDDGDTYHDGNRDIDEPMGRASAVVVCGHTDDTAADVTPLPRPNCLTEWWFDN